MAFNQHSEFKTLLPKWLHGYDFNNAGDIGRLYALMLNVKQVIADGVPGDMAEVGVFRGNSAAVLAHYARLSGRTVYLFDTFEGFDSRDLKGIDKQRGEDFSATSLPEVEKLVGQNNVEIIKGYFPQSIPPALNDKNFAVVHLDCDLYEPMRNGVEFFYPRLSPGGLMLLHDYSSGHFPGAKQAIDDFTRTIPEYVVLLPDKSGTAVLRKAKPAPGA